MRTSYIYCLSSDHNVLCVHSCLMHPPLFSKSPINRVHGCRKMFTAELSLFHNIYYVIKNSIAVHIYKYNSDQPDCRMYIMSPQYKCLQYPGLLQEADYEYVHTFYYTTGKFKKIFLKLCFTYYKLACMYTYEKNL